MKKLFPIIIVSILVLSGLGAVALPNKETKEEKIIVSFSEPILRNENQYITINIDETNSFLMKQNKPMIPSYTKTFTFPFGTKINDITCKPKNIQQKPVANEVMTTPKAMIIGDTITSSEEKATIITNPYPEKWYESELGCGIQNNERYLFVKVNIYPVKYYNTGHKIEWADDVEVTIEYELPKQSSFMNDEYEFIVLTPSEFSDELNSLITHKNNRGIPTKLVTLSEIYGGTYFPVNGRDEPEKIKYFIKNAIENWGTNYVLLVGAYYETDSNYKKFPIRKTHIYMNDPDRNEFVSDLYYADIYNHTYEFSNWDTNNNDIFGQFYENTPIDSDIVDLHPDVYLGRLACNDENQVTTSVNKIINYENIEAYTQNWFTNIITIGGDSFPGDDDEVLEGEIINKEVIRIMDGFIPTQLNVTNGVLGRSVPSGVTSINNAINEGCGFIDFSGHGNYNIWATHPHMNENKWLPTPTGGYTSSNINDLNNGDKLPIIVTGACSVSKFNKHKNCFSWAYIQNEDGGGIASFGATGLGYAYLGKWVKYGLVEKISLQTFDAYDDGAITIGEMWTRAINSYISNPGLDSDADYKTVEEWCLFGDPTLAIAEESLAPEKPEPPEGKSSGGANVEYTYTASTTDPDGDQLYYLFEWGDGTFSGWVGPKLSGHTVSSSHKWTEQGEYEIRVKAKDEHGVQSDWSDPIPISMPRNKQFINSPFIELLERFPRIFPIIRTILELQ